MYEGIRLLVWSDTLDSVAAAEHTQLRTIRRVLPSAVHPILLTHIHHDCPITLRRYLNGNSLAGPVPVNLTAVITAAGSYGDFEFEGNKLVLPPPPEVQAACDVFNTCLF
jgi:hypothetical protein